LIVFSNFDQFLNQTDFRAGEKAYQLLAQINAASQAQIIIQTHEPDNYIIKNIRQNSPELFYQQELANRQMFNYPPFSRLLKIICQEKNENALFIKAERIIKSLKEKLKNQPLEIMGPFVGWQKNHKIKVANIIIKTPTNFKLERIFKLLEPAQIIDIDVEKIN